MKRILALLLATAACSSDAAGPRLDSSGFIDVGTGDAHTCALITRGRVFCFGSDRTAQLGNRATGDRASPVATDATATFTALSVGAEHTCALDSTGQVSCWGNNNYGQLGNGTTATLDVPVVLETSLRFASVSAGAYHTCALTAAGEAYCWGAGAEGQLGNGQARGSLTPVRVAGTTRFSVISGGGFHTCGLALDGRAFCWGQNSFGQLGIGRLDNTSAPALVVGGLVYKAVSAGETHSCGVATDGKAYCWGSSTYGELGTTFVQPSGPGTLGPSPVFGNFKFASISAGYGFTCGVQGDSTPWCWGRGLEGQVGNGHTRNWATPQPVSEGQFFATPFLFARISAGRTHACGVTSAGALYCWGRGESGQLGNTATAFSPLAIRVPTQ